MAASLALLAYPAAPADAFPFGWGSGVTPQPQYAPPATSARAAKPARRAKASTKSNANPATKEKAAAKESSENVAAKAKGILTVVISLDRQQLTLYSDGQAITQSRVSTGTASHPTPTGVFSVIQKNRWHRSNIYDNAPMFYMQRLTWSGVAMHQGIVPNQPASHGCIRLPEAFARHMWGITRLGARVIVTRGAVAPVAISHARLFTLGREPLQAKAEAALSSSEMVGDAHRALEIAQLGGANRNASHAPRPDGQALGAMAFAAPKARETTSTDVVRSAYDQFEAPKVRRARTSALAPSGAVAEVPSLKPGPISVFISRKEGKLFVRKGFEPVFSVPVMFQHPERPLGTHVFTALSVNDDNTTLRWHVVSLPTGGSARIKGRAAEPALPASNPGQALDRITIPPEALDRISELMSPGASLIVSDQGLGPETGLGTDFIVLTK